MTASARAMTVERKMEKDDSAGTRVQITGKRDKSESRAPFQENSYRANVSERTNRFPEAQKRGKDSVRRPRA